MPERLSDDGWLRLLEEEQDAFRLTIRAWAALEAEIDALTEQLFRVPMQGGIKNLGSIWKRISVASALGVVPKELAPALDSLRQLRNDFAHGDVYDIDETRANSIIEAIYKSGYTPEALRPFVDRMSPRKKLELAFNILRAAIQAAGKLLYQWQRDARQSLAVKMAIQERLNQSPDHLGGG
jgi:hypothetical protein